MGRFDHIDLGADAAMLRMCRSVVRQRREILTDAIARLKDYPAAQVELEAMIQEELKEVGL